MLKPKRILRLIYQLLIGLTVLALLIHFNQSQANEFTSDVSIQSAQEFAQKFKAVKYHTSKVSFDFSKLKSLDDNESPLSAPIKLVNLWATWCLPCVKELPTLSELSVSDFSSDVDVLALSMDFDRTPERLVKFVKKHNVSTELIRYDPDGDVRKWADDNNMLSEGLPLTLILTKNNKILFSLLGEADWSGPEAKAFIKTVIKSENL